MEIIEPAEYVKIKSNHSGSFKNRRVMADMCLPRSHFLQVLFGDCATNQWVLPLGGEHFRRQSVFNVGGSARAFLGSVRINSAEIDFTNGGRRVLHFFLICHWVVVAFGNPKDKGFVPW